MNRLVLLLGASALAAATAVPAHATGSLVKDASEVTMSEPSLATMRSGEISTVTGRVSGVLDLVSTQRSRSVALELQTPNGWMPLRARATTDDAGGYRVRVPSSWYYQGAVRTKVSASDTHLPGVSTTTATVTVKPPYAPQGQSSSWRHLFKEPRARWNPCKVISYKVNATGGPERAVAQVKRAIAKVAAATGLRFRYDGATNAIPWRTDGRKPEYSDAALTVSWATPKQVADLEGWTAGWGGSWYADLVMYRGGITLDRTGTSNLENGFGRGATWGALLMHELGHVIGLGHVDEAAQVMYPSILSGSVGRFGAGDLAGLRDQGAMNGCTPAQPALRTQSAPQSFATR